jgi:hypothetical protein
MADAEDFGKTLAGKVDEFVKSETVGALEEKISRLNDDLRLAKRRAIDAEEKFYDAVRIREAVFGLTAQKNEPPAWTIERSEANGAPHIPVLVTSDFQWGEVIDEANMDGLNRFDIAVAEQRYRLLIDRTIDIAKEHLPKNRYDGIIYLRLGDQVSGDIHEELRETNQLSAIPAVRSIVASETQGLRALADAFGKVHVISVPGNHGRTQKKPPYKRASENYDTLSAWWLESSLGSDARFSWHTPDSTDAVFDMHGRLYLATHGDRIGSSGGQGFIGPAATIMRGMKKTMDEYARRGTALSKMFVGHFHTAYDLGYGWSNGSLPGYSEFARGNRMTPEPPTQWLIFFHPRYGATSQWKILLDQEPRPATPVTPFA